MPHSGIFFSKENRWKMGESPSFGEDARHDLTERIQAGNADPDRPEVTTAKEFLAKEPAAAE
jgi:hypothetical protein